MSDATKPNASKGSKLFRDECALCGEWADFTGKFVRGDDGQRYALFHCPACQQEYRVWKQGLEEAWRQNQSHQDQEVSAVRTLDEAQACVESDPEQARHLAEQALNLAAAAGDDRTAASSQVVLGRVAASFCEFSDAIAHLKEAEPVLRHSNAKDELGLCLYLHAYCLIDEEDTANAEKLLREADSHLAASEDDQAAGACSIELARLLKHSGRENEAIDYARKAIASFDRAGAVGGQVAARRMYARLLIELNRTSEAIQVLDEALSLIVPVHYSRWARRIEAELREELGDACATTGDQARAEQLWTAARETHTWLDQNKAPVERLNSKLGQPPHPISRQPENSHWPRPEHQSTWHADPPDPNLPPVECVSDQGGVRKSYRGSGVVLSDHPQVQGRPLPDACLKCGSRNTVCADLTFTETPQIDKEWEYSLYCRDCGIWSGYRCWE